MFVALLLYMFVPSPVQAEYVRWSQIHLLIATSVLPSASSII